MIIKILVAVVVIAGLLAAFVATRPTDFAVTRSATYAAPVPAVFAQVNELVRFKLDRAEQLHRQGDAPRI